MPLLTHPLLVVATLTLGALTPAKVSNVATNSSALPPPKSPTVIYVDAFSVTQTAPKANDGDSSQGGRPHLFGILRGGEDNTLIGRHREEQHDELMEKLPGTLQKALIENLNKSIAPAAKGGGGVRAATWNCWVITGQFLSVDQGSGALQAGVGFGAGQSEVEVQAQVYTLRDMDTPFLVFDSKGASGHMPGAIMMKNPYVAAAKFVMSKKEPDKEAKKVAKSIADAIGKFMVAQGIPTIESKKQAGSASVSETPSTNSSKASR